MTVQELIALLAAMPADAEVVVQAKIFTMPADPPRLVEWDDGKKEVHI